MKGKTCVFFNMVEIKIFCSFLLSGIKMSVPWLPTYSGSISLFPNKLTIFFSQSSWHVSMFAVFMLIRIQRSTKVPTVVHYRHLLSKYLSVPLFLMSHQSNQSFRSYFFLSSSPLVEITRKRKKEEQWELGRGGAGWMERGMEGGFVIARPRVKIQFPANDGFFLWWRW